MQSCILKGDRTLLQLWSLIFASTTERKFCQESSKYQRASVLLTTLLALAMSGILLVPQELDLASFSLCIGGLCLAWVFQSRRLLNILATQLVMFGFSLGFQSDEGFFSYLGVRLVPFTCHYLLVKRWNLYLASALLEGLLVFSLRTLKLHYALGGVVFYVVLYTMHERDYRDVWFMSYINKLGYTAYFELYLNSLDPVLILTLNGDIASLNKAAANWFNVKVGSHFEDSFQEEHRGQFLSQLAAALSNGTATEERYILKSVRELQEVQVRGRLGMLLTLRLISWVKGRYIEVSCKDVTDTLLTDLTMLNTIKRVDFAMNAYGQDLVRRYTQGELVGYEVVSDYSKIEFSIKSMYYHQNHLLGEIDIRKECFDVNAQCQNLFELSFYRAASKGLSLNFVKEPGIPTSLSSDKNAHNLLVYALLQHAIAKSLNNSEISVVLSSSNITELGLTVGYKFIFQTAAPMDLNSVLSAGTRKCFFAQFVDSKDYGLELAAAPAYLQVLNFRHSYAHYHEDQKRMIIQLKLPFERGNTRISTTMMNLHGNVETNISVNWNTAESILGSPKRPNKAAYERNGSLRSSMQKCELTHCAAVSVRKSLPKPVLRKLPDIILCEDTPSCTDSEGSLHGNYPTINRSQSQLNIYQDPDDDSVWPQSFDETYSDPKLKRRELLSKRIKRILSAKNPYPERFFPITSEVQIKCFRANKHSAASLYYEPGLYVFLVVDDSETNRDVLCRKIKDVGDFKVDQAANGHQAIDFYRAYSKQGFMYRIIFIDSQMPDIDGYETTARIRQIEREMKYPASFLCGVSGDRDAHSKNISAGMNYFCEFYIVCRSSGTEEFGKLISSRVTELN